MPSTASMKLQRRCFSRENYDTMQHFSSLPLIAANFLCQIVVATAMEVGSAVLDEG